MKRRAGRLAAWFGLDGNPLRRRSDRIASFVITGLFVVFLAGAPVASLVAWHWSGRVAAAEQQHQRAWRQVQAIVVRNVPVQDEYYYGGGSWSWGRWTAPDGHRHQGVIPVPDGTRAGSHVRLWVNAAGLWAGPPLSRTAALVRGVEAAVAVPLALAAVLFCLGCVVMGVLERQRLTAWETAWTWVGPQWTRQFRARG